MLDAGIFILQIYRISWSKFIQIRLKPLFLLNAKNHFHCSRDFQQKRRIIRALNSLIAQTDKDFEVIIVDDGSFIDLLPTVETFKEMLNIQYFKNRILDLVYPEITVQIAPKMIGWFCRF